MYSSPCPNCAHCTDTDAAAWRRGKKPPRCGACGAVLLSRGTWVKAKRITKTFEETVADDAKRPTVLVGKRFRDRRKKPMEKRVNQSCRLALDELQDLKASLERFGIRVEHRVLETSRRPSIHVFFNDSVGQRVADYWPGTGKLRTASGETFKNLDMKEVVAELIRDRRTEEFNAKMQHAVNETFNEATEA